MADPASAPQLTALTVSLIAGGIAAVIGAFFRGISLLIKTLNETREVKQLVTQSTTEVQAHTNALAQIRETTNGSQAKLLEKIGEQAVEIGRLQEMVKGLQAVRMRQRATDPTPFQNQ